MTPKEFINQLIKDVVKPAFKQEGFAADRTTFRKLEEGFVKIFNMQHSTFNTPISASFYMNLGLYFPVGYGVLSPSWSEWEEPLPQNIKIEHCQVTYRADELTTRSQSWLADAQTDIAQFQKVLRREIVDVLAWFASIKSVEDCLFSCSNENISTQIEMRFLRCINLGYAG